MSKSMSIDQKSIKDLLSDKGSDFLIPDYQRPYAWEDEQCQTLWDDIFSFAFPDNDKDKFNQDDEYFLGTIVTFKNSDGKLEVIDGQQRLTTILLFLRAFYDKFFYMEDKQSKDLEKIISQCIWRTDEFGNADLETLKIDSEVATDNDKEEFLAILKAGDVRSNQKSKYANNYRFFQSKIQEFSDKFAAYLPYLPARILNNCILLPIEAESQDTALRIFSTLNDRGLPLSDADIFKAQFYKYYGDRGEKDAFIENWKELETVTEEIFRPIVGTPMDELFTRYMYYLRAKLGIRSTTVEALRRFYERDKYRLLLQADTVDNLQNLANFWKDITLQNRKRFSEKTLRLLFVLNYAPNGMWQYITSVYYLVNKDGSDTLEESKFNDFLEKITAFIYAYAIYQPGVNSLRTPLFPEMIKIYNGQEVSFDEYKFEDESIRELIRGYRFGNGRPITKSLLAWYAFSFDDQRLLDINEKLEIEHIFAKKRQEFERSLPGDDYLESLGNKVLLEKRINIRASDYKFEDKKRYYGGYIDGRNKQHEASRIKELELLTKQPDFKAEDIDIRNDNIISSFMNYLGQKGLTR